MEWFIVSVLGLFIYLGLGFMVTGFTDDMILNDGMSDNEFVAAIILWPFLVLRAVFWLLSWPLRHGAWTSSVVPIAGAGARLITGRRFGRPE